MDVFSDAYGIPVVSRGKITPLIGVKKHQLRPFIGFKGYLKLHL